LSDRMVPVAGGPYRSSQPGPKLFKRARGRVAAARVRIRLERRGLRCANEAFAQMVCLVGEIVSEIVGEIVREFDLGFVCETACAVAGPSRRKNSAARTIAGFGIELGMIGFSQNCAQSDRANPASNARPRYRYSVLMFT
jgi:hypothetical protein